MCIKITFRAASRLNLVVKVLSRTRKPVLAGGAADWRGFLRRPSNIQSVSTPTLLNRRWLVSEASSRREPIGRHTHDLGKPFQI